MFSCHVNTPELLSFPTRRSSDLAQAHPHPGYRPFRFGERKRRAGIPARGADGRKVEPSQHHPHLRSEEHTSELQSRGHLVCRLLLEKTKQSTTPCIAGSPPTTTS